MKIRKNTVKYKGRTYIVYNTDSVVRYFMNGKRINS